MGTSRNVLKIDVPDSYYHIYARGGSRRPIYLDDQDYRVFERLLQRYLSHEETRNSAGVPYDKLYDSIQLLAYCQMPNHFHLLVYQKNEHAMVRLMRGVMTAYSRYFNKKYERTGALFESRYKAVRVTSDSYLLHISRYIHLNPEEWVNYPYSSLFAYEDPGLAPDWLELKPILDLFSEGTYLDFVADYEDAKQQLKAIKDELADG